MILSPLATFLRSAAQRTDSTKQTLWMPLPLLLLSILNRIAFELRTLHRKQMPWLLWRACNGSPAIRHKRSSRCRFCHVLESGDPTLPRKQMPWLSRRACVGSSAAAASARTPALVSGASGNIVRASCACICGY